MTTAQSLSTSRLAERMGIPARELFAILKNAGWIRRVEEEWVLTTKGEFEGGRYVSSQRYGRYIVWPESVLEHAVLRDLPTELLISANSLGKEFHVSGRYLNHVLGELGWIKPGTKGWRLTRDGEALGGVQSEHEETSIPYVKWPVGLKDNPALVHALAISYGCLPEPDRGKKTAEVEGDLFTRPPAPPRQWQGMDGHCFHAPQEVAICNWLYFAGITHACGRKLPAGGEYYSDFYLPRGNVYIEYWGPKGGSGTVGNMLARKQWYEANEWPYIDLDTDDIPHLDEVLPRELLRHGIAVY